MLNLDKEGVVGVVRVMGAIVGRFARQIGRRPAILEVVGGTAGLYRALSPLERDSFPRDVGRLVRGVPERAAVACARGGGQ